MSLVNFQRAVILVVIAIYLAMPFGVLASATDGTIDAVFKYAWGENIGWVNFGTPEGNVHITDSGMTGYAWGENVGWISLNCLNTSSCGTVNYGVTSNTSGNLAGYAWGENIGWISFDCSNTSSCGTVSYGGDVSQAGEFSGYAWGENVGWLSLSCSNTSSCGTVSYGLKTDYVPGGGATPTPTPGGGGGQLPPPPPPTPSGTPGPTASPTPTATPTASPSPTPTPIPSPTPSPSGTPGPSITPEPSGTPPPATPEIPPPSESPPPITVPGIDVLPQGAQDVINQAVQSIGEAIQTITGGAIEVAKVVAPIVEQSAEPVAQAVTTATGIATAIAVAPIANSASNVGNMLEFLRQNFWQVIGVKRKRKPWGTVYDGKTKQPISFARVELLNSSSRLLESQVTDLNGRYGFLVTPESTEQKVVEIQLQARKDEYVFPSKGITSPTDTVLYENVYVGGIAKIDVEALAGFDLPMDKTTPETYETVVKKPLTKVHNGVTNLLNAGFYAGLVTVPLAYILTPSNLNLAIMVGFFAVNIPRLIGLTQRQFGLVVDSSTDAPMSFALVTLNDKEGKRVGFTVSDERGRYFLLVPEGYYTISAYTPATVIPTRTFKREFITRKGWIKEEIML